MWIDNIATADSYQHAEKLVFQPRLSYFQHFMISSILFLIQMLSFIWSAWNGCCDHYGDGWASVYFRKLLQVHRTIYNHLSSCSHCCNPIVVQFPVRPACDFHATLESMGLALTCDQSTCGNAVMQQWLPFLALKCFSESFKVNQRFFYHLLK